MQEASAERVAIARVEALLDRYGVIAPPMIDKERLDGGFSGLYPVLRRMEEHGALMRGMFVSGCGAAQFASRQTVDALRACAAEPSAVVLDATDPANLYGSVIAWPRTIGGFSIRPARRSGASADDCWHTRCPEAIICCSRRMRIPHCSRPATSSPTHCSETCVTGVFAGVSPSVMPTTSH